MELYRTANGLVHVLLAKLIKVQLVDFLVTLSNRAREVPALIMSAAITIVAVMRALVSCSRRMDSFLSKPVDCHVTSVDVSSPERI